MRPHPEPNRIARPVPLWMRILIVLAAGVIGCVAVLWPKVLLGAVAIIAGPVIELWQAF